MQSNVRWNRGWTVTILAAMTLAASASAQMASKKSDKPAKDADSAKEAQAAKQAKVGEAAPDFELADQTGKKHKLSDYKDKIVVLEWVNQQCPWSKAAIPAVKAIQKKLEGKDIVWLGVESTHWRTPEENVKFIKENELAYPILMDTDGKVGRMYGAKTTPHVFVIDKGNLIYAGALHNDQRGDKPASERRDYVIEAVEAAEAGKAVPLAETKPWGCGVKYGKSRAKKES